jgi:hypothetical protein
LERDESKMVKIDKMKQILLSVIILFISFSVYAERICLAPAGCRVEIDTGYCEMCVDKEIFTTTTPIVKVPYPTQTDKGSVNTSTSYFQYGYPTQPEQNLLTSSIHHFEYDKGKSDMVRIVPFSNPKVPFLVKRSSTRVALCRSGCPSSRASTMGYMHDGFYWLKKPSVWETRTQISRRKE